MKSLVFSLCLMVALRGNAQERPNLILICTDDWGYGDLSCLGYEKDIRTPNLDRLAASGVRFTNGYATAPQCSPSRAGLLTGKYQTRFGFNEIPDAPLPLTEQVFVQRLKENGYKTGMVGKWHLDPNVVAVEWHKQFRPGATTNEHGRYPEIPLTMLKPYLPFAKGFDEFFSGELNQYHANFSIDGRTLPDSGAVFHQPGYRLDIQTAAAMKFIDNNHNNPFVLYLAYYGPHTPLVAPAEYLSLFPGPMPERRRHALAMMYAIDKGVGQLLTKLEKHGIRENTLIVFVSDNGAPLSITKEDTHLREVSGWDGSVNTPLLGEKGMLTEGGIRVPFIASWPARFPSGKVSDMPVTTLDIAPTFLRAGGLRLEGKEDGIDISGFMNKPQARTKHFTYWRFWNQSAVRWGKWKYLQVGSWGSFLFNLDEDAGETKNLLNQYPAISKKLKSRLENWGAKQMPKGLSTDTLNEQEINWYQHYLGDIRITKKSND